MKSDNDLICIIGGMMSGKTTRLLWYLDQFKWRKKNIVAFKPKLDNRYSDTKIITHSGWTHPVIPIDKGSHIHHLGDTADIIGIDEFFMIPGAADVAVDLYTRGKTIVIATLNLSSDFKPFEEVAKILPYATIIDKCNSVCAVCQGVGHYSLAMVDKETDIVVGGQEKYQARCLEHYTPAFTFRSIE